jgi:Tfp pilus assembly protein PilF
MGRNRPGRTERATNPPPAQQAAVRLALEQMERGRYSAAQATLSKALGGGPAKRPGSS